METGTNTGEAYTRDDPFIRDVVNTVIQNDYDEFKVPLDVPGLNLGDGFLLICLVQQHGPDLLGHDFMKLQEKLANAIKGNEGIIPVD